MVLWRSGYWDLDSPLAQISFDAASKLNARHSAPKRLYDASRST